MTRRELLQIAAAGIVLDPAARSSEPENHAFPLAEVQGVVTPNDFFFVRDHFADPALSVENWKLSIEGLVKKPFTLNFSDLLEHPTKKVEAVLECSGNAPGGSAVSNGVWEGVPISFLLQSAQIDPRAQHVLLEGHDTGTLGKGAPAQPYSQIVPLAKVLESTSLVAFKLNSSFLPKRNGFPARALVPGWYAMDSVKWLRRIVILAAPDPESSFYRSGISKLYNRVTDQGSGPTVTRLSALQVKSVIAWPPNTAKLPAASYSVRGFAWSGESNITKVEVSFDRGSSWSAANIETKPSALSWVRWNYTWKAAPGDYTVISRASDDKGNVQPLKRDPSRRDGYELNWCEPVRCQVR